MNLRLALTDIGEAVAMCMNQFMFITASRIGDTISYQPHPPTFVAIRAQGKLTTSSAAYPHRQRRNEGQRQTISWDSAGGGQICEKTASSDIARKQQQCVHICRIRSEIKWPRRAIISRVTQRGMCTIMKYRDDQAPSMPYHDAQAPSVP